MLREDTPQSETDCVDFRLLEVLPFLYSIYLAFEPFKFKESDELNSLDVRAGELTGNFVQSLDSREALTKADHSWPSTDSICTTAQDVRNHCVLRGKRQFVQKPVSVSRHTRRMSASEGNGLMRPFSEKSGGARCFIDKNCLYENAGQTRGTLRRRPLFWNLFFAGKYFSLSEVIYTCLVLPPASPGGTRGVSAGDRSDSKDFIKVETGPASGESMATPRKAFQAHGGLVPDLFFRVCGARESTQKDLHQNLPPKRAKNYREDWPRKSCSKCCSF